SSTPQEHYSMEYIFSILLGLVHIFSIITQVRILGDVYKPIGNLSLALILVAGLAVLIWLGNLNTDYGIGGPTIIILVSMLRNWPARFLDPLVKNYHGIFTLLGWLLAFILLLLVSFMIFRFYQGERRLPLMHVMLDDRFSAQSYLPI